MGFLNIKSWNPFGAKEEKSVASGTTFEVPVGGSLGLLLGSSQITAAQAFKFYKECSAVATVIDIIAEPFADLPVYLDQGGETVENSDVLKLLKTPHPEYTGRLFKSVVATHFLLTGESYIFAGGNFRYPPNEIAPISPKNMSVIQGGDGFVNNMIVSGMMYTGNYARNRYLGRRVFLHSPLMQIKQIRRFSTEDNSQLRGQSKLEAAAMDVRQNLAGSNHNFKTLVKGGRLTLLFSLKEDMTTQKFEEAKAAIMASYSGENGNGIGVVNANQVEVKEMGVNNKDMDFATLQAMTEKAIAKRYAVPLPIISDDSSTYNNLSTAYQALYDNAVIPVANQIYDGLGDLLFPRYRLDPSDTRFCVDVTGVPAIAERMADITLKRRQGGTWTEDELRAEQGMSPIVGGDTIYRPANWLPGTGVENSNVTPSVMGGDGGENGTNNRNSSSRANY